MKTNYHTHTEYCGHACGLPEDYAKKAVECGVEILGMSDHAPFCDAIYGSRMSFARFDEYCDKVNAAQEKFAGKLKILKSVEIEFLPKYAGEQMNCSGKISICRTSNGAAVPAGKNESCSTCSGNYYESLLIDRKMDYLLCGQHFFIDHTGELQYISNIPSSEFAVDYAKSCVQAMESGYFKILAHPDIFCMNESWEWNDNYEKAADILIEGALKTGVLLEFNANGFRRGKKMFPDGERFQYPHLEFWKKVKEADLPAIVGSDAHNPEILWDGAVEKAIKTLELLGIKRIKKI